MPRIDEIEFTKLVCAGKVYRAPCVVYRESVDGRWWRADGMVFGPEDFVSVIERRPAIVVLGIGVLNKVTVLEETLDRFRQAGIECEVYDSREAASRFNELLAEGREVAGAFHLM